MRWFFLIGLTGLWSAVAGAAHSPPTVIRLDYRAPRGCPDARSFADRVRGRLGYDPFELSSVARRGTAKVHIETAPDAKGITGRIELSDPAGKLLGVRQIAAQADACGALASSLAATLSIALDAIEVLAPPPKAHLPGGAKRQKPTQRPDRESPLVPDSRPTLLLHPRRPRAVALYGAAGVSVAGGRVPGVGLGPALELGLVGPHFSLALFGSVALTPGAQVLQALASPGTEADLQASVVTAGLSGCVPLFASEPTVRMRRWSTRAALCPLVELGTFQAKTSRGGDQQLRGRFIAYAGLQATVSLALRSWLQLRLAGAAHATLVRTNIVLGEATLWTAPAFAATLRLDALVWLF